MIDFETINYLEKGNERQLNAFRILKEHQVFEKLKAFDPILTGTIPINIDIETSDLDIVCHWTNKQDFISCIEKSFKLEQNFALRNLRIDTEETVIANFLIGTFEIEVFGQNIPSKQQNAFKHMLIEYQILLANDEKFREEIINLKKQGYKTEPAFAKLLGLNGNPYQSLLNYETT